jgi:hypothetical protein
MTPQPSAAAFLTLDPATMDETLATIFGAQRPDPERTQVQVQSQRDAGAALIAALHPRDPVEAACAARAAAAHYGSMECFRRAMLLDTPDGAALRWHGKAVALSRMNTEMVRELRQGQAEAPRVQPQPASRPAVPPPAVPATAARQAEAPAAKPVGTQDPMSSESLGPLRNGNPRGNPHAAPRCGARTRAGASCRQPAMPNGRCRLHGGHSTGARTEVGRAVLAATHTKHGNYSTESRAFLAAVDTLLRDAPSQPATAARAAMNASGTRGGPAKIPSALGVGSRYQTDANSNGDNA